MPPPPKHDHAKTAPAYHIHDPVNDEQLTLTPLDDLEFALQAAFDRFDETGLPVEVRIGDRVHARIQAMKDGSTYVRTFDDPGVSAEQARTDTGVP